MSKIKVYHGSKEVIEQPVFGQGKIHNDYGQGFYLTEDIEMAREWACPAMEDGIVNCYELDLRELSVLDLGSEKYHVLNWLAVLIENRTFSLRSEVAKTAYEYIVGEFGVSYNDYDVIKGYRADDSYFAFAGGFLNNAISLQQLNRAIALGNLGEQLALKSQRSFSRLRFELAESVDGRMYFPRRSKRDSAARKDYKELSKKSDVTDIYVMDILRQKWRNEDVRI